MQNELEICKEQINSSSRSWSWATIFFLGTLGLGLLAPSLSGGLKNSLFSGTPIYAAPSDETSFLATSLLDNAVLPLVALPLNADLPIYRQTHGGQTYRFLILEDRLALIVSLAQLQQARKDPSAHEQIIATFPADLLKIWFDDAQHWLKWLEGWDDAFMG